MEAPADVSQKIKELSLDVAQKAVGSLEGAGVFAVELFLTGDGQVCFLQMQSFIFNIDFLFICVLY